VVTISGRTAASLSAAVESIRDANLAGEIHAVVGDVTDEDSVAAMVSQATDSEGRLHGVIANAGGGGIPMAYGDVDTAEFTRVLNLNVLGTLHCMKQSIPGMLAAGGASFIGMSSLAGHITHPFFHAYCAGKAGIEAMMRNAADEYGARGLRFNAIRPGFIATEIMAGIPEDSDVYRSYIENTPMQGVGQPEDVAELARFLIGPESRWITGQCINVDGGHSLRRGPDFSSFVG
jgi:NAD(P)-dependent dehydrogenase (short-subunit alcohol dehydrogenase family)